MAFDVLHRGFCNGPEERFEFGYPAPEQLGPTWSTYIFADSTVHADHAHAPVSIAVLMELRCRAVHPDHDCQCLRAAGHADARHVCWHPHRDWPAWRREGVSRVPVPSRTLVRSVVHGDLSVTPAHVELA